VHDPRRGDLYSGSEGTRKEEEEEEGSTSPCNISGGLRERERERKEKEGERGRQRRREFANFTHLSLLWYREHIL
jgi:hypothetical protein